MSFRFVQVIGMLIILAILLTDISPSHLIVASGGSSDSGITSSPDSGSKVSGLLSFHIKVKSGIVQLDNSAKPQLAVPGMDSQSIEGSSTQKSEKVYLHFAQRPTSAQLSELTSLGVTTYTGSWVPPIGNHKTGFVLADMPIDKVDSLAAKSYVVSLDTAEQSLSPQNDQARAVMNVGPVWSERNYGAKAVENKEKHAEEKSSTTLKFQGLVGKIAYISNHYGNDGIYIMSADGSNPKRLTNMADDERFPALSPDGKKIAFISWLNRQPSINVMNSDGSNLVRLPTANLLGSRVSWSPDSTKLVYAGKTIPFSEIFIINADGSNEQQLTFNSPNNNVNNPSWSPDGSKIAFDYSDGNWQQIYVVNIDGTDFHRLVQASTYCYLPSWSPDGTKIAYLRGGPVGEINIVNADGSNNAGINQFAYIENSIAWSPDGSMLCFLNEHNSTYTLSACNSDGTNLISLIQDAAWDSSPSWSVGYLNPGKLAFVTNSGTLIAGQASNVITIQTQDNSENPVNVASDTTIHLASSSANGFFSLSDVNWANINIATIPTGSNSINFYYKDTTAGVQTVIAGSTGLTSATQLETIIPAAKSQIRVETAIDESGIIVPAQLMVKGISIRVYAVATDQYGNFVSNSAGIWSLVNKTGAVVDTDLAPAGDNKSAVFTAHQVGTTSIRVTAGSLTSIDSGMLTISLPPPEGEWQVVRPPLPLYPGGMSFIDSQEGWAVHGRTIGHTVNGGTTWTELSPSLGSAGVYLLDVDFIDANCGWVSGTGGTILHTNDGGNTWNPQTNPLADVVAIDFTDTNNGWALDEKNLAHTIDGGKTWNSQPIEPGHHVLQFLDVMHGWIVNDSSYWHTSDGGETWQTRNTPYLLGGIFFVDNMNGWMVAYSGLIMHTSDGGVTWNKQTSGTSMHLLDVSFADQYHGWAVGTNIILSTIDGGNTWLTQATFPYEGMGKVFALDEMNAYSVGVNGSILHTMDSGLTWVYQGNGVSTEIRAVNFIDEHNGWAGGLGGTIMHTSDGGITWKPQESTTAFNIMGISFADELNGWAAAHHFYFDLGAILHTSDGGVTWTWQIYANSFYDVAAIDANSAWATGQGGVLLYTSDGGKTWLKVYDGSPRSIFHMQFIDAVHGWLAAGEYALHTSDGGVTWEKSNTGIIYNSPSGMYFVNDRVGWIISDFLAVSTTDGGKTWIQHPFSDGLNDVYFTDELNGWIAGGWDTIFHTDDAGKTWHREEINVPWYSTGHITAVSFFSATKGLAFGSMGTIVRYGLPRGAVDPGQSTLTPETATIIADGVNAQTLTVTAKDTNGNAIDNGGAVVMITRSSGTGTIGPVIDKGDGTYTAIVTAPLTTGAGVFMATINGQPVKSGTGIQTQTIVTYLAGVKTKLTFGQQPTSNWVGTPINPAVSVRIEDANGNVVTSDNSTMVTLAISGNTSAVLSGNSTIKAIGGLATFSGLSINPTGTYTLTATSNSALTTTTSSSFNVISSQSRIINIIVVLQGEHRPNSGWVVPITFKLFNPGANLLTATPTYTFNLITTKSGNTAIAQTTEIPPGTYDVTANSGTTLLNIKRSVEVSTPTTDINMGTLIEGNANGNNIINIQDFGILAANYGKSRGSAGFDPRADFDRNDIINIADFGLMAANYSKYSPITTP